jgi:hypothetical protein
MNSGQLDRDAQRSALTKAQARARAVLVSGPFLIAAGAVHLFGAAIHSVTDAGFYMLLVLCGMTLATSWVYTTTKEYTKAPIAPPLRFATRDAVAVAIGAYIFGAMGGGYGLAIIAATTGVLLGMWLSQHIETRG